MPTLTSSERTPRSNNSVINRMSPEERRQYMAELSRRGHARRLQLTGDERDALVRAYQAIGRIMVRHGLDRLDLDGEEATRGRDN